MDTNLQNFETFVKLKILCKNVIQEPKDMDSIKTLKNEIKESPKSFIKVVQPTVLSTFYPILKNISENKSSYNNDEKQLIVDTLKELFDKCETDQLGLFFNIYAFLLFEIYDPSKHLVLLIHEEYKLSIMACMTALANSIADELITKVYTTVNAPRLCQMLYVALEIAKTEQLRTLRISAIECIMSIARVLDDDNFNDIVVRNQVSEVFLFFLPGIASGLKHIALEDEKVGHKIPTIALKAWGRIVTLLMQDYNSPDEKYTIASIRANLNKCSIKLEKKEKWKNENDVKEYLHNTKRTKQWYEDTDKKLQTFIIEFQRLTHHPHQKVRSELVEMASLIINNCTNTMPVSISHLIEIIITLSEDDDQQVASTSKRVLNELSTKFSINEFKTLLENLEEGFLNGINSLPRKFNGFDEKEQIAALNLLIGYISLFGNHKLEQILLSTIHLNKLMLTLIHISELEKSDISLLEEYTIQDFEMSPDLRTPWAKFRYFREDSVKYKLEHLFALLAKFGASTIISDFLLDIFLYDPEHSKEATFILNGLFLGLENNNENDQMVKNIITTYTDHSNWYLPLTVMIDQEGYEHNLSEVQDNIIKVCLLVEGVGKCALNLKNRFQQYLLKVLYLVLERAGSNHPVVRAAGLTALTNVTISCGYSNITELINTNIDYFTYHVERQLNKMDQNEAVLDVLTVVLKYSTMDVLPSISHTINEVLMQSCDKFKEHNINSFLRVFKIFLQRLRQWLNIEVKIEPLKSKAEKQATIEDFQVSGIDYTENYSKEDEGKTAEEMYKEDMEKRETEQNEEENEDEDYGYKKPEPPMHIKLTVAILSRSLHFLPSRDKSRKLLAIDILCGGVEIIRDHEDDLLPIVHQIWSPLVQRFKEFNEPLIISYSFQLLVILARVSKDFIRSRTSKDVLPSILEVLSKLSRESYLKDKGSAFRYTQAYKLQNIILNGIGRVLTDLDVQEKDFMNSMECVVHYLSDKQPIPLQVSALEFYKTIGKYDQELLLKEIHNLKNVYDSNSEYEKNINEIMCKVIQ